LGKRYHERRKTVKKVKEVKEKVKEEIEVKSERKALLALKSSISIYSLFLALIMLFMLYVRIALPWNSVFLDNLNYINFAADDAVYHMRLVENTIANYPARIFYDPFTHFPFGSSLHFGPLWTLLIATIAILLGARSPTDPIVYMVGAYMPAVLGTLTAIPVYYIAKTLFGRRTALLSLLILAVLPGQFLSRTVLGFADHHVAEIFFSTLTMAFYLIAIDILSLKREIKGIAFSLLAGIAFAAYLLSWPGAVLFSLIIFIFTLIQSIVENYRGVKLDYLALAGIPVFLIPLLAILPYFTPTTGWSRYSWFHVAILALGAIAILLFNSISRAINKWNLNKHYYPLSIAILGAISLTSLFFASRDLFDSLLGTFSVLTPAGGALTISEVQPMLWRGNQFTLALLWANFTFIFYFAVIAFILTLHRVAKYWRASETLFATWNIIIIWATFSQNRFAYYSAINIAILAGYFWWKIFSWTGIEKLLEGRSELARNFKLSHGFAIAMFILTALYPAFSITIENRHSGGADLDWINSLMWLRNNTPDPGLDYYGIYKEPNPGEFYDYSESAYGVMSWWDYGHIITYIAHRIPNANPFQSGIIERNWTGAAPFLTAENETEANRILDFLGARYVISDAAMASGKFWAIGTFAKKGNIEECYSYYYQTIQTSQGPRQFYSQHAFDTMELRLHFFDGDRFDLASGKPEGNFLTRYRLIYESPAIAGTFAGNQIHYIKIFEYVKGARIKGEAPAGVEVNLSLNVTTNQGRSFIYKQQVLSNGSFEFVVPYSNTGPITNGTNFAVESFDPYKIEYEDKVIEVKVTEEDVIEGNTIYI
jgi:dolichyl-diphosphooligosaccharide--protein glycosyltransferase